LGYFLVLWSLFSYGALGICHKLAERKHCRPKLLAMMVMLSAFLGMNVLVVWGRKGYGIPLPAFYVAITCGVIALGALWAFQEGIKRGKIATSWLIINLSSAIPTIGSILIYHEPINFKKIVVVALIFVAIVLVWKDGLEDLKKLDQARVAESISSSPIQTATTTLEREM
jgi:drug/metabolite transporter (DMT)-like permease